MQKEQQTDELLLKLYDMTKSFTRQLQPRYYYQFRGSVDDLASEFFTQFITPKGRKGCVKETLLDKFNPSITSLAYLVKVSVTRKLIDQSRKNPQVYHSIDKLADESGDCIIKAFNLISTDGEDSSLLDDKRFISKLVRGYHKLTDSEKNKYFVDIFDSQSKLVNVIHPVFLYVRDCPIQQITNKTVVLYVPQACRVIGFSLEDGHARGKFQPFTLNECELTLLREKAPYHSCFSKELLTEYLTYVNSSRL